MVIELSTTVDDPNLADERERLIHDLVAIPSPSGEEATAALFLAHWMAKHGIHAYVDRTDSVVGIRGDGDTEIVLLGHLDTVPGDIPVRIEGRKLYGRGSVDAKGALAAFIFALTQVEPPRGIRFVVIGASQEETDKSLGARHALERFRPKACLIGEPSQWDRITLAYKGRLALDWSFLGPLAHAASPTLSPAEHAFHYWHRVQRVTEAMNSKRKGVFNRLDVSLRGLNTRQDGCNGVADMRLEFRLPPDLHPKRLETKFREMETEAQVDFSGQEPTFVAEKNTYLTRSLLRAIRASGGRPRFVHKTGTSDMNIVGPVWDCPIAAYGPGDSSLDHTPDEHLDLDEFQRSIEVVRLTLENLRETLSKNAHGTHGSQLTGFS